MNWKLAERIGIAITGSALVLGAVLFVIVVK